MDKPVIGITTSYGKHNEFMEGVYLHHDYQRTVAASGGLPVLIPNTDPETALAVVPLLDGLIVSGGEDVNPVFYGQEPHPKLGPVNTMRDQIEIALLRHAANTGLPVLAICRGMQVLNVALGGTLIQDIPAQVPNAIGHAQANPRGEEIHSVQVEAGTRLHGLFGQTQIRVNSLHHQAADALGSGLQVAAYAPDGIVEALELPGHPFAIGVQWHPESMVAYGNPSMRCLFQGLMAAAAANR